MLAGKQREGVNMLWGFHWSFTWVSQYVGILYQQAQKAHCNFSVAAAAGGGKCNVWGPQGLPAPFPLAFVFFRRCLSFSFHWWLCLVPSSSPISGLKPSNVQLEDPAPWSLSSWTRDASPSVSQCLLVKHLSGLCTFQFTDPGFKHFSVEVYLFFLGPGIPCWTCGTHSPQPLWIVFSACCNIITAGRVQLRPLWATEQLHSPLIPPSNPTRSLTGTWGSLPSPVTG